ncbi:hypothetical protein B0H14DRAFT_3518298 [Mycena olivaceomarginata]|nr:hypothetical protein B0H14DRAFT_3518298 [Mycena olivaceomarginata]
MKSARIRYRGSAPTCSETRSLTDAAAARARATAQWQNLCVKFDALWPAPSSGSHSSNADSPPDDYYHIVEQFLY